MWLVANTLFLGDSPNCVLVYAGRVKQPHLIEHDLGINMRGDQLQKRQQAFWLQETRYSQQKLPLSLHPLYLPQPCRISQTLPPPLLSTETVVFLQSQQNSCEGYPLNSREQG